MTWLTVALLLGAAQAPAAIAPEAAPADSRIVNTQQGGLARKEAARELAASPVSAAAFRALMQQDRVDEALDCLVKIVDSRPDEIAGAVQAIGSARRMSDGAFDYAPRLRSIFARAHEQAARLPREAAAATEYELIKAEGHFNPQQRNQWRSREAAFMKAHAGTKAAAMAEIAQASDFSDYGAWFERLDAIVRRYPRTDIAARALYEKAFNIGANVGLTGPSRQPDPTQRFMDVLAIVGELESGAYPASEWVDRAPSLVFQFHSYKPEYRPGSIDRMLEGYATYLRSHFRVDPANPLHNGAGYVIASRMGELFALKNDATGVERFLTELESQTADAAAVRYLRAVYLLRRDERVAEADRAAARTRAIAMLTAQSQEGDGVYARKALATLASLDTEDGRHENAVTRYREYLARHPRSAYAWMASVRLGEALARLGRYADALETHTRAIRDYASNSLAVGIARGMAAQACEALGDPDRALTLYEQLVAGWDHDYGADYSPSYPAAPRLEKVPIIARIADLRASLAQPGGALLERGRYRLAANDFPVAEAALKELAVRFPRSPLMPAARRLLHRVQLESALAFANIERPGADPSRARALLETLAAEPFDEAVAAGRIARATMAWIDGRAEPARAEMKSALDGWLKIQTVSAPDSDLQKDLAAIRDLVVLPTGGGIYATGGQWDSFKWPAALPPFLLVNSAVGVKLSNGETSVVTLTAPLASASAALFVSGDQVALLDKIMVALGGTRRREPTHVMQVPNQPAGQSVNILALWNGFFPCRPGHWGGWEFVAYPRLTRVEFLDGARTKASAAVTIGYSGASVVLEKVDGVWKAIRLTNFWVT